MDIVNAQAASLVARPDSSTLSFQRNQHFAAEVLKVSGDQVTLVLDGTPFVARLTTAEQAAALTGQRTANFVVRDTTGNLPQIQILPRGTGTGTETPVETGKTATSTLIPNLLRMAGLTTTDSNTTIAQALIRQGLPVNSQLVNDLNSALSATAGWGTQEANQAALLKASGLPLTPETLAFSLSQASFPSLTEMVAGLRDYIAQMIQENPQKTALYGNQFQEILNLLNQMNVDWNGTDAQNSALINQVFNLLGHSVEQDLANFLQTNLPGLGQFSEQAAFEQNLGNFLQENFPFLNTDERAAMQKEILQLLQNNPALLDPDNQDALEHELSILLQNHATGPAGLSPLEFDMEYLIQHYAGALASPEGGAALTDDILTYVQSILTANQNAEGEALGSQLAAFIQTHAGEINTPEGQALLNETLAQLLGSTSLSGEALEELKSELAALLGTDGILDSQATLEKNLTSLLQKHLTQSNTWQGQETLANEIVQLIQNQMGNLPGEEGYAILSQDLARLVQKTLISASAESLAGIPQELAQFLQKNASFVTPEARSFLEQEAARLLQNKTDFLRSPESQAGLTALARLRSELAGSGLDDIVKKLDNLLDRVRWMQFENLSPQTTPLKEQWLTMEIPLGAGAQGQSGVDQALVQIRVAYQSEEKKRKIDPNNTHVMLHFELGLNDEFVDVDLAVVERKIGAQITVSNTEIQPIAEDEIVPLGDGLEEIGYFLQTARCDMAKPAAAETPTGESSREYVPDYVGKFNLKA